MRSGHEEVTTPRARVRAREWKPKFLTALRVTGSVTAAAEYSGIHRRSVYKARDRSKTFAESWDEALNQAKYALETEARRRAIDGADKPIFYKGVQVATIKEYSDRLLEVLLKAHMPEKYRERFEHTGADGGPIRVDQTIHTPDAETWAEIMRIREELGGEDGESSVGEVAGEGATGERGASADQDGAPPDDQP